MQPDRQCPVCSKPMAPEGAGKGLHQSGEAPPVPSWLWRCGPCDVTVERPQREGE